jgi:hypothetical protein
MKNTSRTRGFASLDKYGDERDLLAGLLPALDFLMARPPHRLGSAPRSAAEAADARVRVMLACNVVLASRAARATADDDPPTLAAAL